MQATIHPINISKPYLTRAHCRTLTQLRTNKPPVDITQSLPLYVLCNTQVRDYDTGGTYTLS